MNSPFKSKYRITQEFKVNADYYKQFGLKGHEGIDLVPNGTSWDILALADGVVVLDDDVVGSVSADPYGKIVTIWHPALNKATMYCHLNINWVTQGELVKKGQVIGQMGSTGNTNGAHLHLNLFETDANGIRLNKKNGYNGGIDPLPFLQADDAVVTPEIPQSIPTEPTQTTKQVIIDTYRALCGEEPSADELKARLKSGINTYDLIRDICKGDIRFKRTWVYPAMVDTKESQLEKLARLNEMLIANPPKMLKTAPKTVDNTTAGGQVISDTLGSLILSFSQLLDKFRKKPTE